MWAIPTGASWLLKKKKGPSPESRTPNSVRIRQSGRAGNRGVTLHDLDENVTHPIPYPEFSPTPSHMQVAKYEQLSFF